MAYYTITSNANKLVLGVAPTVGSVKAVIPTHAKPGDDGQLWRDDADTETIRSKTDDTYCMDIANDQLVINEYCGAGDPKQKWKVIRNQIVNMDDQRVLQVEATKVIAARKDDKDHQSWTIQLAQLGTNQPPKYYFIKSKLSGLVLDVESSNTKPGAWVSTWGENGTDAQKWYDEPSTRTIRSKLNDFCMDIDGGRLVINPHKPGKDDQLWERKGSAIVNIGDKKVLDIAESNEKTRARVTKYAAHGGPNQSWTFEWA